MLKAFRKIVTDSILSSTNIDNSESENMLESRSNTNKSFCINIISLEGDILIINITPDFTIEKIKAIAIKHFYNGDASKIVSQFRLIHSSKYKQLIDDRNIADEDINADDELILVEIRSINKENLQEENLKGPTLEAIAQVTNGLIKRNPTSNNVANNCNADFQKEFRKILITLVKASARILTYSADAKRCYSIVKEKLESRCKPTIDSQVMKVLIDMGFPEKEVIKALKLKKSNMSEALEWLVLNTYMDEDDENNHRVDDMSLDMDIDGDTAGPSFLGGNKKISLKAACTDLFEGENEGSKAEGNLIYIVDVLLESFRQYKMLEFKPNPKLLHSFVEMGFPEKSVVQALKITGNDHSNACEWLLGERRQSLYDLDEGLDRNGRIYEAIMNAPSIQLSLTNPRMLIAYLSMLERPTAIDAWNNDPEVSLILNQIFKIYHAEKYTVNISHLNSNY
ncbi:ubiquitin-associated domain-containing protein 1 [Prorops nasuta]|uniref:ubiquitin-associated domain-containing protein 1 n=1 Tax=Prorops nasuta TaxID=863751 RepID=UPI0034CD3157